MRDSAMHKGHHRDGGLQNEILNLNRVKVSSASR